MPSTYSLTTLFCTALVDVAEIAVSMPFFVAPVSMPSSFVLSAVLKRPWVLVVASAMLVVIRNLPTVSVVTLVNPYPLNIIAFLTTLSSVTTSFEFPFCDALFSATPVPAYSLVTLCVSAFSVTSTHVVPLQ